jgi:hypothetical protein
MKRLLPVLGLLATACTSTPEVKVVHPEGLPVRILPQHSHSRFCGHYVFHDTWYFMPQHRHGVACGHEQIDGLWRLLDE